MINSIQITEFLQNKFELPSPINVTLIRSYTNDVYKIVAGTKTYLLKVYGQGWRTEEELLFEVDLLNFLKNKHVRIAAPVMGGDKKYVYFVPQDRLTILFEWAGGNKPVSPFNSIDRELLGKAIAKIHLTTDGFKSKYHRKELGVDFLIKDPLNTILDNCEEKSQKAFFSNVAKNLSRYIETFISKGLDFGIVHADATFDNIHMTKEREVIFYDFDSGGLGWRAIDLQGWAVFDSKNVSKQEEFINGYRTIREISDDDVRASSYLHVANEFWGIALDVNRRISRQGIQAVKNYLITKETEMKNYMEYFSKASLVGADIRQNNTNYNNKNPKYLRGH